MGILYTVFQKQKFFWKFLYTTVPYGEKYRQPNLSPSDGDDDDEERHAKLT